LELELESDEELLIKSQHFDTKEVEFDKKFFPLLFGIVGLVIIIICASIIALNLMFVFKIFEIYIAIFLLLIGLIFFSLSCFLLISKFYETKTYFIITSVRIMRLLELKHGIKIKRQIKLSEISHIIDWDIALEVVPERSDSGGHYNGTETEDEFSHKVLGIGSIIIRFNDPNGEKVKKEMKKIIIKNTNLQKHPNMEFLYYKFSL
jgi:hypothetical protein